MAFNALSTGPGLRIQLAIVIAAKLVALILLYQWLVKPQLVHVNAQQVSTHMVSPAP